jgi:hypothetical protein
MTETKPADRHSEPIVVGGWHDRRRPPQQTDRHSEPIAIGGRRDVAE